MLAPDSCWLSVFIPFAKILLILFKGFLLLPPRPIVQEPSVEGAFVELAERVVLGLSKLDCELWQEGSSVVIPRLVIRTNRGKFNKAGIR